MYAGSSHTSGERLNFSTVGPTCIAGGPFIVTGGPSGPPVNMLKYALVGPQGAETSHGPTGFYTFQPGAAQLPPSEPEITEFPTL